MTNSNIETKLGRQTRLDRREVDVVPFVDSGSSVGILPCRAVVHGSDGREGDRVFRNDVESGSVETIEPVVAEPD